MKKRYWFALAFALLVAVTGCSSETSNASEVTPSDTITTVGVEADTTVVIKPE